MQLMGISTRTFHNYKLFFNNNKKLEENLPFLSILPMALHDTRWEKFLASCSNSIVKEVKSDLTVGVMVRLAVFPEAHSPVTLTFFVCGTLIDVVICNK